MKIIDIILGFFKNLFGKKKNKITDGECNSCSGRDVCQTIDKNKKYSLIVGMETSKYGACPGADKDSNTMLGIVSQYVDSSHIVKLNNKQSTVDAVRKALTNQIEKVPEDGLFIFTYSGHGGQTNYKPVASNETDGKDEFLCLFDGYILDDELWTIFNKCKGRVFVVFDCCHSSTMFRLPSEPIDEELDDSENRLPLDVPFFAKYENVRSSLRMFVISGCGEETVSWGDAIQGGVLTSSLKRAFNKCLNYREWWNSTRSDNAFKKVKQIPIATNVGGFDLNAKIFN